LDEETANYLAEFCQQIQRLDQRIRFVGIADYAGKLLVSYYRLGLIPLMDKKETEQYALQTVFRARTREGFKPQLGEQRYATAVYEKLIRATIIIAHPDAEHHNMYLLISLDTDSQYPIIINEKIIPYISENKKALFLRTLAISNIYED
jgi:hypothetical protein